MLRNRNKSVRRRRATGLDHQLARFGVVYVELSWRKFGQLNSAFIKDFFLIFRKVLWIAIVVHGLPNLHLLRNLDVERNAIAGCEEFVNRLSDRIAAIALSLFSNPGGGPLECRALLWLSRCI